MVKQIKLVKTNCNCFHPSLPTPMDDNTSFCNNLTSFSCGDEQIKNSDYVVSEEECPMECNKIDYSLSTNSASYPTAFYTVLLKAKDSIKKKFSPKTPLNFDSPSIFDSMFNIQTTNIPKNNSNSLPNDQMHSNQFNSSQDASRNIPQNDLSTSCLKVSIYYGELSYIYIEENPAVTWESLLGTVGKYI